MSVIDKKYCSWLKSQWYRCFKQFLNSYAKVPTDLLLTKCLGQRWCCWQTKRNRSLFTKLDIKRDPAICRHSEFQLNEQGSKTKTKTPIQLAAQQNASKVIGFQADLYFRGWHQTNYTWKKLICNCGSLLNLNHFLKCRELSDTMSGIEARVGTNLNQLLDQIKAYRFDRFYKDY